MDISGVCEIAENNLNFTAKLAGMVRMKSWDFTIPLKSITEIEYVTLNLIMPIGVCITLDDGKEYMFGSLKRKALKKMLEMNVMESNQRH
ncbi:MAG: hypothetical protein RR945_10330 [Erysipelotrichaceae bacterium]